MYQEFPKHQVYESASVDEVLSPKKRAKLLYKLNKEHIHKILDLSPEAKIKKPCFWDLTEKLLYIRYYDGFSGGRLFKVKDLPVQIDGLLQIPEDQAWLVDLILKHCPGSYVVKEPSHE